MQTILEVSHVTKSFHEHGGRTFRAVDDISLTVETGECVGIVGESGSGKSTLARIITRLIQPDSGSVTLCGTELTAIKGSALRAAYRDMKMIFQEPRSSFDPRLTLGKSLNDALKAIVPGRVQRTAKAEELMERVGLDVHYLRLYPTQVSGGECQRAAIARAIAQKPRLLICDEATSALDVSVQAQIVGLLMIFGEKADYRFCSYPTTLHWSAAFAAGPMCFMTGRLWSRAQQIKLFMPPYTHIPNDL